MVTEEEYADIAEDLLRKLNNLIVSLSLPLTMTTLYDLTPSFLLAILESILRARLPISDAVRESQTTASKVEAMKIFLGVLEDDVLRQDIGLSDIDPRRLAAGEWDDLFFVGETLCWIAQHQNLLRSPTEPTWYNGELSSAGSSKIASGYTGFSQPEASESSVTTVSIDMHPADRDAASPILKSVARVPRCIHEVEPPSFSAETLTAGVDGPEEFCDCSEVAHPRRPSVGQVTRHDGPQSGSALPPVRYDGRIEPADDDVPSFELWRERSRTRTTSQDPLRNSSPRHWSCVASSSTDGISSPYYTLSLLQERARLLGELAKMKGIRPSQLTPP